MIAKPRHLRVLAIYGLALAFAELLAAAHWQYTAAPGLLSPEAEALCWPFFERCDTLRTLPAAFWNGLFALHALLAFVSAFGFWRVRPWARWVLLACDVVKLVIVAQDYQLRLNQHYMTSFIVWTFALLREPQATLRCLLVGFYVAAGLLKLDPDWLSGQALYAKPWLLPQAWIAPACAYVVALELVFVWGLLWRSRVIFGLTLAQLGLFHLLSWPVVSFYYPLLMCALLSLFVIERLLDADPGRARGFALAPLVLFTLLQLAPLAYPSDRVLTGEGRWLALHMFDARVRCDATATPVVGGVARSTSLVRPLPVRIQCDPLVFFRRAEARCRAGEEDFDFAVIASRASERLPRVIASIPKFCASGARYRVWPPNPWLRREPAGRARANDSENLARSLLH